MTETNLLPCPWCNKTKFEIFTESFGFGYGVMSAVRCLTCYYAYAYKPTKEQAIAAWNTRHKETEG